MFPLLSSDESKGETSSWHTVLFRISEEKGQVKILDMDGRIILKGILKEKGYERFD
jgi:hypothetical protein